MLHDHKMESYAPQSNGVRRANGRGSVLSLKRSSHVPGVCVCDLLGLNCLLLVLLDEGACDIVPVGIHTYPNYLITWCQTNPFFSHTCDPIMSMFPLTRVFVISRRASGGQSSMFFPSIMASHVGLSFGIDAFCIILSSCGLTTTKPRRVRRVA